MNALNNGAIPNLPDDAIVEVNAQINAYGIRPVYAGPLPDALAAHLSHYFDFQQQVVKAALSGDREAALHAFVLDPTTASQPRPRPDRRRCWTRCSTRTAPTYPLFGE